MNETDTEPETNGDEKEQISKDSVQGNLNYNNKFITLLKYIQKRYNYYSSCQYLY